MAERISIAVEDFRRARRQAAMQAILARLTGKSADLLSFEEVRKKLRANMRAGSQLEEIPLDAIVGSVGRYTDFTRDFLPRVDSDEDRWARVKVAVSESTGLPPIEVYKIGGAYFVSDGNHRVSIARHNGDTKIQAYVTELKTNVPLTPDTSPDDLILKAEYVDFLAHTKLDRLRPEADLSVTTPGRYWELEEEIDYHHYKMNQVSEEPVPRQQAVIDWYDNFYMPVIEVMRARGILHDFPGRTETDLYVWVSRHQERIAEHLGWDVSAEQAAADLADRYSPRAPKIVTRVGERLLDAVTPDEIEPGPRPGYWREVRQAAGENDQLFRDLLVPISHEESSWTALDQALRIAQMENARIHGLHVVPNEEDLKSPDAEAIKLEFETRCHAEKVVGELTFGVGSVPRVICDRARWVDLIVLNLAYPPAPRPLAKLGSGFHTILRRCSRPVLAVPGPAVPIARALLAYDGSPKAEEALYVATYLTGQWDIPLVVLTISEKKSQPSGILEIAQDYLDTFGLKAEYKKKRGPVAETILKTCEAEGCDLIIMGGYGHNPVLEVVLGSAVDQVLRESRWPMLICR
jgi:nucleotide-binding universal stress UspA family protein